MVQCSICKLWEHFGCAGVNEQVKQRSITYTCKLCEAKQEPFIEQIPSGETRPLKGSKTTSKAGSRRGKKNPDPPKSTTSSVRVALLEEKLKLVEEELRLKEYELLEQNEIKQRQLKEEERQLDEKRKLAQEERDIRERKLKEELALKRMQQQIRKESFERRLEIIRQQAQTSSRGSSISDMGNKVKNWLNSSQILEDRREIKIITTTMINPSIPMAKMFLKTQQTIIQLVIYQHSQSTHIPSNYLILPHHAHRNPFRSCRTVPHVIKTLRTLYGRPELIIRSLMSKIQYVPAPRHDRLETLICFGLSVQNLVDHLKAAGQQNHLSNPTLMQDFVEKLPGSMRLDWAIYKNKNQPANLETFGEFMSGLVTAASEVSFEIPGLGSALRHEKRKPRETGVIHTHSNERTSAVATGSATNNSKSGKPCGACGRVGHRVADCHQFKGASLDERWKLVQQKGFCRTCLNSHGKWPCRSWNGCGIEGCRQKHHTLLHCSSPLTENVGVSASHVFSGDLKWPLFRIVPVVLSSDSNRLTTFAFIDEGSSYTLLEESVAKQLGVEGHTEPLTLQWTENVKRIEPKSQRVQIDISGKGCGAQYKLVGTRTDYELVQPKLLIGLDNLRLCVPLKLREGGPSDPIGAKCRLGWSIYGCIPDQPSQTAVVNFHVGAVSDPDRELNEQLRDFFTLDKAGISHLCEVPESDDDKRTKQLLVDTTRRVSSGSGYETGLLWRTNNQNFPDSYPMALRRLEGLERKLQKDPSLEKRVREQIYEYERKGYAHKANLEELTSVESGRVWYLPLGFVTNPRKPEKLRLIWDAAAKMFHQIKIRAPDCQSQRFLFRERPSDHPQVYVMDVATFGSTCSPASAQFVKNLNADEFATEYPRAAVAIKNNHYVDDYLDSFESVNEAIAVVNEIKLVHSKGGFTLRHFLSNETEVLQKIGETDELEQKNLDLERGEKSESVLGMNWLPYEDVFVYALGLREDLQFILLDNHIPTKREIARVVMSLFDPLGFIAFFLVHGKILLQDIWAKGTEWDQKVPEEINERWQQWSNLFPQLNTLHIPRCYFRSPFPKNLDNLQLHVFVDASEAAYACAVYFRLETDNGVQVALVGAKTKVAPLKTLSIPKLELNAAVLGTRLMGAIQSQHTFPISRRYLWSDSGTVLAWIRSRDHRRYKQFVAVRVGEILTSTEQKEWMWVPSKLNVVDLATKWGNGPQLNMNNVWFQGQGFIHASAENWPRQ
ncbi:uncharacterized protein LOC131681160 [Topomyia yanbarensis]|uniref:uncharacterized protein LOC131681160 n=1 Tax=Topomyia yanbarensis TaxID=2498891 RepID=UPI00273AA5ED|nr:uncharacterized protein LOC131681160 [Topomyia yanbarensis]